MNTFYPENDYRNYLAHYGVKGMKWGIRHDKATRLVLKRKGKRALNQVSDKNKGDQKVENIGKQAVGGLRSARNIHEHNRQKRINKQRRDYTNEISRMSTDELRRIVNRKTLERQYNDIRNQEETRIGKDYLGEGLFYAIELTSIAASVATTAVVLNQLLKKP